MLLPFWDLLKTRGKARFSQFQLLKDSQLGFIISIFSVRNNEYNSAVVILTNWYIFSRTNGGIINYWRIFNLWFLMFSPLILSRDCGGSCNGEFLFCFLKEGLFDTTDSLSFCCILLTSTFCSRLPFSLLNWAICFSNCKICLSFLSDICLNSLVLVSNLLMRWFVLHLFYSSLQILVFFDYRSLQNLFFSSLFLAKTLYLAQI